MWGTARHGLIIFCHLGCPWKSMSTQFLAVLTPLMTEKKFLFWFFVNSAKRRFRWARPRLNMLTESKVSIFGWFRRGHPTLQSPRVTSLFRVKWVIGGNMCNDMESKWDRVLLYLVLSKAKLLLQLSPFCRIHTSTYSLPGKSNLTRECFLTKVVPNWTKSDL